MSLGTWPFTDRAYPVVELGVGDTRVPSGQAVWDTARWDTPGDSWAGTEPTWHDITCDTLNYRCEYGRQRTTERFIPGTATVIVRNTTGWADPHVTADTNVLTVRPGRAIRMGVVHQTFGVRWLYRGFIDAMTPTYDATEHDLVELACIDALGEVNRAKFLPQAVGGAGETIDARIGRVLDAANWPAQKRDLQATSDTLIADDLGGQAADLIGQAADSGGGSVFGDYDARIAYRPRDWQTYEPGDPVDGEISNVDDVDTTPNPVMFDDVNYLFFGEQVVWGPAAVDVSVCPIRWERPFDRADITTRVIMGRDTDTAIVKDDTTGRLLYGIEPFERTDLLTESDATINVLAQRILRTRGYGTAPRVRSVSLNAATGDNAVDLLTTVDVYKPSRYRCRLVYPRGTVFDGEHFATGVAHDVTPTSWTLELNLDVALPFQTVGDRWDGAGWDNSYWAAPVAEPIGATT